MQQGRKTKKGKTKKGKTNKGKTIFTNQAYLPSDPPVSKDTVKENVESLTAVKYDVDPLDRKGSTKQGEEPRESKQEGEEEGVPKNGNR